MDWKEVFAPEHLVWVERALLLTAVLVGILRLSTTASFRDRLYGMYHNPFKH